MARQHATPLLISPDGISVESLRPLTLGLGGHEFSEAAIQALIQEFPNCLPIAEIDPLFIDPVPICTELNTPAGPIDNFMVTASGLPVLVECKLWRNPEGRREVVGQILDYAKELSRWTSSDLQREVSRRLRRDGNTVLELVRSAGHEIDEIGFNDALTTNLRRGRFLLLIVGDGIREGVEAISEYLQTHAGLHFTLGLVEMPIHAAADGSRVIAPRVLAKTVLIGREVVAVPDGFVLVDAGQAGSEPDDDLDGETSSRRDFMQELVAGLVLDDPDQPRPRVSPKGWLSLYMPAPKSSCWVSVLDKRTPHPRVGCRLTSNVGTMGEAAISRIVDDWSELKQQLGGNPELIEQSPGRFVIEELLTIDRKASDQEKERALQWLQARVREFVAVFRPRIRDAVEELAEI
ncbi:MAG: hypothetical protein H7X93_02995 [Sphingomonadaceae bacterium]|nr:hypothetical protein [Sphingomonadaceae bacterium]